MSESITTGRSILHAVYFSVLDGMEGAEIAAARAESPAEIYFIEPLEESEAARPSELGRLADLTICVLLLSDGTFVHGSSYWHEAQNRTRSEEIERELARRDAMRRLESHPTVEEMAERAKQIEAEAIRRSHLRGERRYPLRLQWDDAGNCLITCDSVPEFAGVGRTIDLAMRAAEDAMATARMIYQRDGRPFPPPSREPLPGERWVTVSEGDA